MKNLIKLKVILLVFTMIFTSSTHAGDKILPLAKPLEKKLTEKQISNIANAYKNAGTDSINGFKKILLNLISKNSKTILGKKI